jgi:hypothetical protein
MLDENVETSGKSRRSRRKKQDKNIRIEINREKITRRTKIRRKEVRRKEYIQ